MFRDSGDTPDVNYYIKHLLRELKLVAQVYLDVVLFVLLFNFVINLNFVSYIHFVLEITQHLLEYGKIFRQMNFSRIDLHTNSLKFLIT